MYNTIDEYELITKKMLLSMNKRKKFPSDIIKHILKDQNAFSLLVSKVMEADWKHDPTRSTLRTSRYNFCLWGVKSYITNVYKIRKRAESLEDIKLNFISNNEPTPYELVSKKQYLEHIKIKTRETLTDRHFIPIYKYYFEGKTYQQIGDELGYSREYVRILIKQGREKLRDVFSKNY